MLPRAAMLATKKPSRAAGLRAAFGALALLLGGCTEPGPRALLEGDRLIREGKCQEAVQQLETARRHLPQDPRVWHWLGMAYQGAGDPRAVEAYQTAIQLDRSNQVAVAHYNLGCLYLEQNNVAGAVNELRSYRLLTNSLPGLLRLGQAELRARQWDAAEKTFGEALRLSPKEPAACNGLGLVHYQRNRLREAGQQFQNALRADPKYGPAILNLAILYHQQPGQRAFAAQKYREYLALSPAPPDQDAVKALLSQLEQPVTPPSLSASTNGAQGAGVKTNVVAVAGHSPSVPTLSATQRNLAGAVTNQALRLTNAPRVAGASLTQTQAPATAASMSGARTSAPALLVKTSAPPRIQTPASPPAFVQTAAVTVVNLPEAAVAKPAQDVVATPPAPAIASTPSATGNPATSAAPPAKQKRKSFLQKLNPFGGGSKADRAAASPAPPRVAPSNSPAAGASAVTNVAAPQPPPPPRAEYPRYAYLGPAKPAAGDRKAAEPSFSEGLAAHRQQRTDAALKAYRAALEKDPSYFEAYYNIGEIALQAGDWRAAINACEYALALNPKDLNTRLNLGRALDNANYPIDAVNELGKAVELKPDDARAHLALANLYAQKLNDAGQARRHYLKVLEISPRHPRADQIRYWLAANP